MSKRDYYDVLGLERTADASELKRAYRKLAVQFHPDRNPDDPAAEERFKEAAEAYQVLSDDDKRRIYDAYGHEGLSGAGFDGFGASGGFEDIFSSFGDILGDLFGRGGGGGGGGGRRRAARGSDLRYDLEISFTEAAFGCKKSIDFHRREGCETCRSSGVKPGTSPESCGRCSGSGRITRQQGFFMVQTTCPVCRGRGRIVKDHCEDCEGEGMVAVERTLTVTVPAGVDTGVRMRVSGEGEGAPGGGARGDLYVFISAQAHELFEREGADVHSNLDIPFSQAALGAEVDIETLHGSESIKIPAGTQPGTVVRLRRKGIARLNNRGSGDHYVNIQVRVPDELSKEQRGALEALGTLGL